MITYIPEIESNDDTAIDDFFYMPEGYEEMQDMCEFSESFITEWQERLKEIDTLLSYPIYEFSQESFYESIKELLVKLIKAIATFFKWLIDRLKQFIRCAADLLRNKPYLKIMDFIHSLTNEDSLAKAYDMYGNTNLLDDSIEGLSPLSESAIKELQYIKYTSTIFDNNIKRISVVTSNAIDSISKILGDSLRAKAFLRTGGAEFGNRVQEKTVSENDVILEFFQDKNFQSFIYQINSYTDENLNAFLKDINDKRGKGIYSRFNYEKFNGVHLALAVILNKKIEDISSYISSKSSLNNTNIPINTVITKDLLLKIRNKDNSIIEGIRKDSDSVIKASTRLEDISQRYYDELQKLLKNLEDPSGSLNDGLTSIRESQQWITILISFSNYFFNHKIHLLNVAQRATCILYKKAKLSPQGKPDTNIRSTIGSLPFIRKELFDKFDDARLHKLSQYIMRSQVAKLGGVDKPAHIIIVKGNSVHNSNTQMELANTLGLYTNIDDKLLYNIHTRIMSPVNNALELNRLINVYDKIIDDETYKSNDTECKLYAVVIRIYYQDLIADILENRIFTDDYLPTYFFGTIVHESTHVKQMCDIEKTLKKSKDMENRMTSADEKNDNDRERRLTLANKKRNEKNIKKIETIQNMHIKFSYKYSNFENEANSEEENFVMSIVNSTQDDKTICNKIHENILTN